MANKNPNTDAIKQYRFKPGQSGNPGGHTRSPRSKIEEVFDETVLQHIQANCREALERLYQDNLPKYFDVVQSRLPKDKEVKDVTIRDETSAATERLSDARKWAGELLGREMDRAVQAALSDGSVLPDPVCPESSRH